MTPTKTQQAQEYAEKKMQERVSKRAASPRDYINRAMFYFDDMEQAYLDGYTACEQSQWRSVEDEEPPIGKLILCRDTDRVALAYFDGEAITEAVFPNEDVTMPFWMPIPSLPDTNTEKL